VSGSEHTAVMGVELALWQKVAEVCQGLPSGAPSSNFDAATSHEKGSVSLPL